MDFFATFAIPLRPLRLKAFDRKDRKGGAKGAKKSVTMNFLSEARNFLTHALGPKNR